MKKLLHKLHIRRSVEPLPARITSDTVAEHRERILAGGRRFKYPIQYARHRLVINAILISVVALLAIVAVVWQQLYIAQNTSEFMYRITKFLPIPVASVDGQPVLYSDYLMRYLSSVHYLVQKENLNLKTDDGKRQVDYMKQQSMKDVIADAYAAKLAHDLNISISDTDLETFIKNDRQTSDGETSQQTYDASILETLGWSPDEYRHVIKVNLLRHKVSYAIDKNALNTINNVSDAISQNQQIDFKQLAATYDSNADTKVTYGVSGLVPRNNQDGGLSKVATGMKAGQVSSSIQSTTGDGYYYIRLLSIDEKNVSYEYIKVALTEFNKQLDQVIKDNKVKEYISIPETANV